MNLLDGDLLEIGKPSRRSTLAFHALGKIGAVFGGLGNGAFGYNIFSVIAEFVNHRTLSMVILVDHCRLRFGSKISLGFEGVLQLVDDGTRGAQVAILAMHLRGFLEATLGLQMILERGHDVTAASWLTLELSLGLRLVGQGGGS